MAIAFDAVTTSSSTTFSHTVGAGSNRILWVGATLGTSTITGVTYNGVAMTLSSSVASGSYTNYLFWLVAPASGAHNVVFTNSGGGFFQNWAASYTGASQTGVPEGTQQANQASSNTTGAVNITTTHNNCWMVGHGFEDTNGGGDLSQNGGNLALRTTNDFVACFDSNAALSPAGTYTGDIKASGTVGNIALVEATFMPVPSSTLSVTCASMNYTR